VTCRHCHQPIQCCPYQGIHGTYCQGWIHLGSNLHTCASLTAVPAEVTP
jgi:hypothetical protein